MEVKGVRRKGKDDPEGDGDRILKMFGKPERLLACECERSNETTLSQAFLAISDAGLQHRLSNQANRLRGWLDANETAEATIDELYWTALAQSADFRRTASGFEPLRIRS